MRPRGTRKVRKVALREGPVTTMVMLVLSMVGGNGSGFISEVIGV